MPLLDRQGEKPDVWTRIETACEAEGDYLLALSSELDALLAQNVEGRHLGVFLRNNESADALEPYFGALSLIAIHFPAGTDGRGFSLARQLRQRGYTGTLRASGPLFSDQFPQALACGFDEVDIPSAVAARQPVAQWLAALNRISLSYQHDYAEGEKIFAARRARSAGAAR